MFMRYKPYPLDYIMDVDDFMIYCVYGLFGCVFVNKNLYFCAWIYHYLTFIQEISVFITSSYQVIEVSPFTTALIEHIYTQYHRPNAMFYDQRVSVGITTWLRDEHQKKKAKVFVHLLFAMSDNYLKYKEQETLLKK